MKHQKESQEKMFRFDSSRELDYIRKRICPFCKQKIDISEFADEINKEVEGLRVMKAKKLLHLKDNPKCKLARKGTIHEKNLQNL